MATTNPNTISRSSSIEKPETPEQFLTKVEQSFNDQQKINEGTTGLQKVAISKRLEASKAIEKQLPSMHILLSKVPEETKEMDNFIKPGNNIVDSNKKIIEKKINDSFNNTSPNKALKKVKVSLTKEERRTLAEKYNGLKDIPHTEFDKHVFGANQRERPANVYRQLAILAECVFSDSGPYNSILDISNNNPANTADTSIPPVVTSPDSTTNESENHIATKEDIYTNVNGLLAKLSPPEYAPVVEIKERASETDVQNSVNAFQFSGGPADQPAFYDFYSLQIAFEHVWQEIFDQSIKDLVLDAYGEIVNSQLEIPTPAASRTLNDLVLTLHAYKTAFDQSKDEPFESVVQVFEISQEQWWQLNPAQRQTLKDIADNIVRDVSALFEADATEKDKYNDRILSYKERGKNIIQYANQKIKKKLKHQQSQKLDYSRLSTILDQLDARLKEKYAFTTFAANERERSINFGLVLNYRQKWTPLTYQAGELIKTIPLAPKETRKFSKKITNKHSRTEKDTSSTSSKLSSEISETMRSEAEVIDKALKKATSNVSTKAGYSSSWSPWSFSVEASYGKEASSDSSQTKKDFREAVVKSAQELKNDRSVEINTSDSSDFEAEESGEISNPNDEIAITYLFYELQRRYRLNEFLNRITPVVLVAQEVPRPDEIDEDWLICYHWILSRVILDQSFQPALYYLVSKVVGDEYAVEEQRKSLEQQREMVNDLQEEFIAIKEQLNRNYKTMEGSIERRIESAEARHHDMWTYLQEHASGKVQYLDVAKMREEAAREEYDKAIKDEKEMRSRFEREVTALQAATDNYTKALSDHLNRKTEIKRLQVHVKDNLLYYMQAIWTFEPADQRYFRLFQTKVPVLNGNKTYNLADDTGMPMYPNWDVSTDTFEVSCALETPITYKTLVEVADVDRLLGFKGNYMIFPLLESNALTDFMMAPYINKYSGIADPDPAGSWSLDDYNKYVVCLKTKLDNQEITQEQFDSYKPALIELYKKLITDPLRENEEIIIPTNSLFIEALPGTHPILEDFKLMHRAVDVKKVQAEVRYAEMENLRSAARLIADELEDPSIEKKIVIEGGEKSIVINSEGE